MALAFVLAITVSATAYGDNAYDSSASARPYLNLHTSRHSTAAFDGGQGSVQTDEHALAFGLAGIRRGPALLAIGVDYEYTHLAFDDVPSRNRDVHRLQFPVRFAIDTGRRELRGFVAPGIATSSNVFKDFFNRGSGDDLTIAGKLEIGGAGARQSWFAGVAYDQAFGRPRLYPVAGIDTRPKENLRVRIAFPDSGAWYRLSARHALSARIFPSGDRWRVVNDDFSADFDLRREEWRLQLTWSVVVTSILTLDFSTGQTFDRRLVLSDQSADRIDAAVESELFTRVGFRLGGVSAPRQ